MADQVFRNPFRPGAGQMPPYLAGRDGEIEEFMQLLKQETILDNVVLTGLRGVGKTVLLEVLKPRAMAADWLWVGADLSESTSVSEATLALRLLTDLAVLTSRIVVRTEHVRRIGFDAPSSPVEHKLNYEALAGRFGDTPGLVADKLKSVLEEVWQELAKRNARGVVFAYDEAQTMADSPAKDQYPLSVLLDVFQSIQRRDVPFMLVLTGLPTLFPKLVESRTFAERMFHVVTLGRLSESASREAIEIPLRADDCPVTLADESIDSIIELSGGYPYFIQFICREACDALMQKLGAGEETEVAGEEIVRKLDADFFAGRWARARDRQRELLGVIASLDNCDDEFTVQEVVERSKAKLAKPFSASHVNQMLVTLAKVGLVYKNRHGKYSFAVPLFGQFILRQAGEGETTI